MARRLIILFALSAVLLFTGAYFIGRPFESQPVYHAYTHPFKVNNVWYNGASPLAGEDGTLYYPLSDLAGMLGIKGAALDKSSFVFGDYTLTEKDDGVLFRDGAWYASASRLEQCGLNLYINDHSVSYIDNFKSLDYTWAEHNRIVAHAMGGYDGHAYTNSLDAFLYNYELGHRVFEVDFLMSADNVLLAAHEWSDVYHMQYLESADPQNPHPPLTVDEFTGAYLYESLTPLTVDDVIQLMIDYPDIYIVTDSKEEFGDALMAAFEEIISAAEYYDPSVLDRIIPQIYSIQMYEPLFELYDWKSAIFTMYRVSSSTPVDDIFDFTYRHGIKAITAPSGRSPSDFCQKIHESGGYLYLHTYSDLASIEQLTRTRMIHGVYTDFLAPDAFDSMPDPLVIPQEAIDAEAARSAENAA